MIPPKLKIGHHIRIISTPASGNMINGVIEKAISALNSIGLKTSFSKLQSDHACSYINEINEAFLDTEIHGLLLCNGVNDDSEFHKIDCDAIKANPKIIAGLAEASQLAVYLYHQTGIVNYYGPNFYHIGLSSTANQCVAVMREILMINATIRVYPSSHYGTGNYQTRKNEIWVINEGMAEGLCMIGGNCLDKLTAINLNSVLDYNGNIIFICGNQVHNIAELQRNLDLVREKIGGENISGLIIGGIEEEDITIGEVKDLIYERIELSHIPVLANVNLVKSDPKFTIPIGGSIRIKIKRRIGVKIDIIKH